jgi:CHAT domain-containing protein
MGLLADIHGTEIEARAEIDTLVVAFRLADMARSRKIQHALWSNSARAYLRDSELTDLARREQNLQKQITALQGALVNAVSQPTRDRDLKAIESLRSNIRQLRDARGALIAEIERGFPEYWQLVNPKPPGVYEIQDALFPSEALISIYIGRDRSFIWAVPHEGSFAFASVPIGKRDVAEMVTRVRYALRPNAKSLGEIPEFDLKTAHYIYEAFFEPVKEEWQEAKSLLVITHGPLGYLPLSLLPTELATLAAEQKIFLQKYQQIPWLVRTHAVTILPSASVLARLRSSSSLRGRGRRPFVGFGDPYFSELQAVAAAKKEEKVQMAVLDNKSRFDLRGLEIVRVKTNQLDSAALELLPRLPETGDEVRSMALAMNADLSRDVFTGVQANEQQVKSMDLYSYKVIAFATHGLASGDLDGLQQPALALTSPRVAGIEGDGLLTMGEVFGLRLNADLVVLSACNTAAGDEAEAEALSGLGRAFFYAGAKALLVSNWPVETTSAKRLTTELFKKQVENLTLSKAEALRQAMLALIDGEGYVDKESGKTVFSYAHPIFWAPFTLVGDGTRGINY